MIENTVLFESLGQFDKARILCIGDVMLDKYYYGEVTRISPEAPVPITHVLDITGMLATKLAALGEHRTALACGNYLLGTEGLSRHRALLLGAPKPDGAAEGYLATQRAALFIPER